MVGGSCARWYRSLCSDNNGDVNRFSFKQNVLSLSTSAYTQVTSAQAMYEAFIFMGCLVSVACTIVSFYVPWIRPNMKIKKGLYEIDYPVDIGLVRCFSNICKEYFDLREWLRHRFSSSSSTKSLMQSASLNHNRYEDSENFPIHVPKIPPNNILPTIEKEFVDNFLLPFETASKVSICFFGIAAVTFLALMIRVIYLQCISPRLYPDVRLQRSTQFMRKRSLNIIFVGGLFSLFAGTVAYLLLTYKHLNGGYYSDGVWLMTYTVIGGLICALAAATLLLDESTRNNENAGSRLSDVHWQRIRNDGDLHESALEIVPISAPPLD